MVTSRLHSKNNKFQIHRQYVVIVVALLAFLTTSYLFFLKDLPVFPDEAIYYDMARNLVSTGKLFPGLFPTINQALLDSAVGVSPVYFYILGNWNNVFGSGIESVRSLSLILGVISLGIFYFIAKGLFKNSFLAAVGVLLLSVNIYFSRASRLGRPDILALLILLSCLFAYLKGLETGKIKYLMLAGIFSAIAVITHPMGIINIVILTLSILFVGSASSEKLSTRIRQVILILMPFLAAVYWFLFVFNNFDSFMESIRFHISNTANQAPFLFLLVRSNPAFALLIILELLIIGVFLWSFKKSFSKYKLFLLIGLAVSVVVTLNGRENFYTLYTQPFVILCLLSIFDNLKKSELFFKKTVVILGILYFLANINIQFFNNDNIGIKSLNALDYHQFTSQIKAQLPQNQPLTILLIAMPDPYFDLKDNPKYHFIEAALEIEPDYQTILKRADYMIVTWVSNPSLQKYINQNAESINWVGDENGYRAAVIKLKPRQERI